MIREHYTPDFWPGPFPCPKRIKREFVRRLLRLNDAINTALYRDSIEHDLLPALWSVYTFLWSGRNAVCNPHKNYDPWRD